MQDFSAAKSRFEELEETGQFADALNEIAHFLNNNVRYEKIENLRPIIKCYKRCLDEVKKQVRAIKAVDVQTKYFNPDGTGNEDFMKLPAMERAYLRTLAVRHRHSEEVTSSSSAAANSVSSVKFHVLIAPLFCERYNDGEVYDFESRQQALDELNLPLDMEMDLRTQCAFDLTKQEKSKNGLPPYDEREIEMLRPLVNSDGSLSLLSECLIEKGTNASVAQGVFLYMRGIAQRCRLFLMVRENFEKYTEFDRAEEFLLRWYQEHNRNGNGPTDHSHDVVTGDKFLDQQINWYRESRGFGTYNYGVHALKSFMEKIDKPINIMRESIYKLSTNFYDHLGEQSPLAEFVSRGLLKDLYPGSVSEIVLMGFLDDSKNLPIAHPTILRRHILGNYGAHQLNPEEEKLARYLKTTRIANVSQFYKNFAHGEMVQKLIFGNDLFSQLIEAVMSQDRRKISTSIVKFFNENAVPTEELKKLAPKNQGGSPINCRYTLCQSADP